ncbi:hypothetical protein [Castellaniella sp.]|uniref:hypothetical protein n=1 Tax=Castellaniella sp. TaxID=1955812 RepID=UPI002AFE897C|nr:hypothetical protein [Castellaniella sp.]
MTYADWMIVLVFSLMMSYTGLVVFFGSDYAQKRWNPDYKPRGKQPANLIIARDYRVRSRQR